MSEPDCKSEEGSAGKRKSLASHTWVGCAVVVLAYWIPATRGQLEKQLLYAARYLLL